MTTAPALATGLYPASGFLAGLTAPFGVLSLPCTTATLTGGGCFTTEVADPASLPVNAAHKRGININRGAHAHA